MSSIWTLIVLTILTTNALVHCNPQRLSGEITTDILRRLDELESQGREQHAELEVLREENVQLREANVELVREINNLRERDTELAQRLQTVEERQHTISDVDLQKQDGGSDDVNEEGENLTDEQDIKPDEITIVSATNGGFDEIKHDGQASSLTKAHNRIRQSNQESTIAFFATRGATHAQHLGQHQAVIFDQIITNIGQAYHNSTGAFIAPLSGVYVFSTTILSYKEEAHFSYAINGIAQTNLYVYQGDTYETTSQTAIFHLNKGDDVAIHNNDLDKFVHGDRYSTFSGFLLVPTEGDLILG